MKEGRDRQWEVYVKEIVAGTIASLLVSPTNAILDKSVIEFANGKQSLKEGVRGGFAELFLRPLTFFTSFKFNWMFFVYSMTYCASNLADHMDQYFGLSAPLQKLLVVFFVNTSCGVSKDRAYIRMFGTVNPKAFPLSALGLLFTRDLITMASAFTIPPILGKALARWTNQSESSGIKSVQLVSPGFIQFAVTPLHLLGMDLYNRDNVPFSDRLRLVRKLYLKTLGMRMIRFTPAFGIGGVINIELRAHFLSL